MHAQNGGRASALTEALRRSGCEMAEQATGLQRELIRALLDSGISRPLLLQTIDELCSTREGASAKFEGVNHNEASQEQTPLASTPNVQDQSGETSQSQFPGQSVAEQMLRMDPWQAAKMVKIYMQQHNIPQREVVESTGLNQSHLSQHLNKGTPMRSGKRKVLYSWFERKQAEIQEQYNNISKRQGAFDLEQPGAKKPRRNRFKWGPASAHILYQSYEQQRNPSKEEREALVEACNKAECVQRGVSYSNVEGLGPNLVTESRIYNWFANRRKEETFRMKLAIDAANYPADSSSGGHTPPNQAVPISQASLMSPTHQSPPGTAQAPVTVTSPVTPVATEFPNPRVAQTTTATPSSAAMPMTNTLPAVGTFVQSPIDVPTTLQVSLPSAYQVNGQQQLLVPNSYPVSQPGMMMHTITNMNTAASLPMGLPQAGYHEGVPIHGGVPYQISVGGPIVHMHPIPVTTLPVPPPLQPISTTANMMSPTTDLSAPRIQNSLAAAVTTTSATMQLMPHASPEFSGDLGVVHSTMQEADSSGKVKMETTYGRVETGEEISVGETVTIASEAPDQSEGPSNSLTNSCKGLEVAQCVGVGKSSMPVTSNLEIQAVPPGEKSNK